MKKILLALIVIFAFILCFSSFMIFKEVRQRRDDIKAFESLYGLVTAVPAISTDVSQPEDAVAQENTEIQPPKEPSRNLEPLFEMNSDCIGWVCIPDTNINHPVMHTPNQPHKYIRKNFEGAYSASGVPFLDESCSLLSDNLIIYGHNMSNGTMFAQLKNYTDKSFFEEHPYIEFQTKDGVGIFSIFAVLKIKDDDKWYYFTDADNEESYNSYVSYAAENSFYDTGVIPKFEEQLITLSTCYGRSGDDRLAVIGVRTES